MKNLKLVLIALVFSITANANSVILADKAENFITGLLRVGASMTCGWSSCETSVYNVFCEQSSTSTGDEKCELMNDQKDSSANKPVSATGETAQALISAMTAAGVYQCGQVMCSGSLESVQCITPEGQASFATTCTIERRFDPGS
jgi:hypothetical protein